ncbi:hypothetical protein OB955_00195 [Halobacteria archaeon AArc-m2/3/4]|uniref:Uncharacterized protein n=1 Tax=Natronoglomus mannanivorans TaxID=2979990 RepID=A0ABT2Q8E3_9EURY|nr:hypothetical protein [Halobacteria archaeon AArc-m2/3/4]
MVPIIDKLREDIKDDELSDEEILNVFRQKLQEKDEKVLKTAEVAEQLPVSQNWTSSRLNQLETDDRVHSKSAGQGRVWWLDESEPEYPVAQGIGDIIWYSSLARRASRTSGLIGFGMLALGGLLLLPIFGLNLFPNLETGLLTTHNMAVLATLAAIYAGLILIVGLGLRLASIWIRKRYSAD